MTKITSYAVIAKIRGLPENSDKLRRCLHILTGLTRYESGCISCEIIENEYDATDYILLMEWLDEKAHSTHCTISLIQIVMQSLRNLLSKELDLNKHIMRLNAVRYGTNSYFLAAG